MPIKIVIIGSGPTAIGAAFRLREMQKENGVEMEVTILEKEHEVGGLARSITDKKGFTWDLGVHVTGTSKYKRFLQVIDAAVQDWNEVPRCVKANMRHVLRNENLQLNYVPYPVQESIPYFPEQEKSECLSDFESTDPEFVGGKPENFGEFTEKVFGKSLQRLFIRPYNEKVWTVPLEAMNCQWVEGRVPRANLEKMKKRCTFTTEDLEDEEERKPKILFRYPANMRGVGEMWKKIAGFLPKQWLQYGKQVTGIDTDTKTVTCKDGSCHDYDFIISTIPLVELGRVSRIGEIQLKHSKVVLVGLGIRRPQPEFAESLSWVYFPQPEIAFYRCTFISNFNERLTPNAALFWSVICEIGLDAEAEVEEESLVEQVVRDLTCEGILPEDADVVDRWVHVLPYGYPIPTVNRDEELAKWQPILESKGIYSRGRFGSWKYEVANQDHSFTMGMEVVEKMFEGKEESVYQLN